MPILNLNLSSMKRPQGMCSIQTPLENFLKSCQPYKHTCACILPLRDYKGQRVMPETRNLILLT